ncbi:collagen alpha-6(VI) chain-like isoform X1 [Alosa sapidissima]|uniref:collagen alpha-6(VI) chain-like isoform X1 n=1 Tax=Alosa sapidissima TaxID=34773 RepID=UPI001C0A64ED|nr:collagen alpha-6(VI) chain-like isoform X1 [Alosa sapidissima]XP_041962555.1 collagen alpha-6(VI) chain-like isoform X1 [Alosa sapidissima]XP_041962556.1 collagen alpha-6(VI) chain-like isoform X1 [Alosa sapidissima]
MAKTCVLFGAMIAASCFLLSASQKTECTQEAVADIVFLVDGSWSIGSENFQRIREFLHSLVASFDVAPDHVRIGLAQYSNTPRTEFNLNTYQNKQEILEYIDKLPYQGGGTMTGKGLDFILKEHFVQRAGSRAGENVPQIAVVITDGQSQDNVEPHAKDLKNQGITIYAIGIKDADEEQLKEIATEPHDQHVYSVSDFSALQGISQNIVQVLCTTVEEAKRQTIQVPTDCQQATVADIVFLVDGSSSIGVDSFNQMKQFLQSFVSGLTVASDKVRIGLAQFTDDTYQEFLLKDHDNVRDVLNKIAQLQFRQGGTYLGKGLTFLQDKYFTPDGGSRANVPKIAIVITDGESSDDVAGPALMLRRMGIVIYAIGVGNYDAKQLQSVANKPSKRFLVGINNYQELRNVIDRMQKTVCTAVNIQTEDLTPKYADIFFLVDSSAQSQIQVIKQMLIRLSNQLNINIDGNRMGLAQFGDTVKVDFKMNQFTARSDIVEYLKRWRLTGSRTRNTGEAITHARHNFFTSENGARGFKPYLVLITSGKSDDNVIKASRVIKAQGVTLLTVGLGQADRVELQTIATDPYIYFGQSTQQTITDIKAAVDETADATVKTECTTAKVADIVFIVDESSSINHASVNNFQLMRAFMARILKDLDISSKGVRVGLATYSDDPRPEFYLNTYDNKFDTLQSIKLLPYHGGNTYTGKALTFATNNMFTKERGSRRDSGVQQIAVIITDGVSHDNVSGPALKLRDLGVKVYAVGIKNASMNELRKIATDPVRNYVVSIDDFVKLKSMEANLTKRICREITKPPTPPPKKKDCVQTEEADFFFLIDHSSSIAYEDFDRMKTFVLEFIRMFPIGPKQVRVGLAKFSTSPSLEFNLADYTDKKSLEKAMDAVEQTGGDTYTGAALNFMSPYFDEAEKSRGGKVPRYLIVITDGESHDNEVVKRAAKRLRQQDITIYAIGVKDANNAELLDICGDPKRRFLVNDFDALRPLKNDIVTQICTEAACKEMLADVIFLVDSSGSIHPADFLMMKAFINNTITRSVIGPDSVRMGLLQFSTVQKEEFSLDSPQTQTDLVQKVNSMKQLGGRTLTGQALSFTSQYFDTSRGGRLNVPKILIVITDGEAQDAVKLPAQALRDKNIIIYSIGVDSANITQLNEISGITDRVYTERDFDGLKFLEDKIFYKICHPDTNCTRTEVADMIFLVDGSSSISADQYKSMQRFMTSLVNSTNVGKNLVRFGAIVYSDDAESMFTLNQYTTAKEVRTAITTIRKPGGNTYTGAALRYTLDYFGKQHGGRREQDVTQILFIITDGAATDPVVLPVWSKEILSYGIMIYAIGVAGATESELQIMTGGDRRRVFYVSDYDALEVVHKNISSELCKDIKPPCEKKEVDLVMLTDSSGSISATDFAIMKTFMKKVVSSFYIKPEAVQVALAQFSVFPKKEFHLNEVDSEATAHAKIDAIDQIGQGTYIGRALEFTRKRFFQTANGSRKNKGVSQNLIVITDGDSQDEVKEEAMLLRAMHVDVYVIGVGNIHRDELIQIAGTAERVFIVNDFRVLEQIKSKVVETVCRPLATSPFICSVDIGIGFDISNRPKPSLFSTQVKLQNYLLEIAERIPSLPNLCCAQGQTIEAHIGFRLVSKEGKVLDKFNFETVSKDVMTKVLALQTVEDLAFNAQLLRSFKDMFSTSTAGVKVLIIFTDGLDDPVEMLQIESESLRNSDVHALLAVALDGATNAHELELVEFGRGFGYKQPLAIGMHNVESAILKQIDTSTERVCCGVMCKCSGPDGMRGPRGPPGQKGPPGTKGHAGYPGEEGGPGERGPPGPNGTQGVQGCPGRRGIKGGRGYRGDTGEDGEHGLDGVNGEQGVTGVAGASGERGEPGSPGRRGIRGDPGVKGQRGLRGDPGEPGTDNTIAGQKGENGHRGMQGEAGPDGSPGRPGDAGNTGPQGRRGNPGVKGSIGDPGDIGIQGSPGPSGAQGPRGPIGLIGPSGSSGLPGPQGRPGTTGPKGSPGGAGSKGQKGQQGDSGIKGGIGSAGPRGPPGLDGRDGYGPPGPKGLKGESGFPGYPGLQGEDGTKGKSGGPGVKGNRGRGGNAGNSGLPGDPGTTGPTGHRGSRGASGPRQMSDCELINYVRDNCACASGLIECPAYPTELVIALDMSEDVTPEVFERMRAIVHHLLEDMSIAESNCPRGARVAIVSFSSSVKYLVRFSDYHRKKHLIEEVNNIALERTSNRRNIGTAMRFVARHVFKRTRKGLLMRKVAVFVTNGASQDIKAINTAVLEFKAHDIHPAVISFRNAPNVRSAFEADETQSFILNLVESGQERQQISDVKKCIICYDPCKRDASCSNMNKTPAPVQVNLDLAVLVDGSRNVQADQYEGVKELLGSVVEQIAVSSQPSRSDGQARVALYQPVPSSYRPTAGQVPVQEEFDFTSFQDSSAMKKHIFQSMQQLGGSYGLGYAVEWVITRGLLTAVKSRKNRMVLAIIGGETSYWDRAQLEYASKLARCQGVVLFTLTVGDTFNTTQVEELASLPLEQHMVHLGEVKQGDQEYAKRFLRTFLSFVKREVNTYPSATIKQMCRDFQQQNQGSVLEAAERPLEKVPWPTSTGTTEVVEEFTEEVEEYTEQTGLDQTRNTQTKDGGQQAIGRGDTDAQCELSVDAGRFCGKYEQRWYYNTEIGACSPFWYGGCDGNSNRFNTESECFDTCSQYNVDVLQQKEDATVVQDVCNLRQDEGSCREYALKWYYDTVQNECLQFWYGGCDGNGNRFETKTDCEAHCVKAR